MTRTSDNHNDGNLMTGSSIPGLMSELNLFIAKVQHKATDDALDAYLNDCGPAIDVAEALEGLTYDDCRKLGEHTTTFSEVGFVAYSPESIVQTAVGLAARFRKEHIESPD